MLLSQNPLAKAKTLITAAPTYNADMVETLTEQIAETNKRIQLCFGVESGMKKKLQYHLEALSNKKEQLIRLGENPQLLQYKTLSTDVLKWRDRRGLPTLVPFMLDHPHFYIAYRRWSQQARPNLPQGMESFYQDVFHKLERMSGAKHIEVTATFNGVIPEVAREAIKEASKVFGQSSIVLLSDTKLKINKVRLTPIDPIAAAFKYGKLFYICDFDLTPLEKAALEFPGVTTRN